ncbi:MAG: hypothetical protein MJ005_04660, partial [Methanocorpusculum sp.]|nr:hypothetical protein [Methanocorpusculum sp.]
MKKATKIIGAVLGVLLVAALFTGAAAADDQSLGDVYAWQLYADYLYDNNTLAGTVWSNGTDTVTFQKDPVWGALNMGWCYIGGDNITEGTYSYTVGTTTYKMNVKLFKPAPTGLVLNAADTPVANLSGAVVDNKFKVKFDNISPIYDPSVQSTKAPQYVLTNPDGTLTTADFDKAFNFEGTNPYTLDKVNDLGEYALQVRYERSGTTIDNTSFTGFSSVAPAYIYSAPTYFTIYKADDSKSLTTVADDVLQGNLVTVVLTAPYSSEGYKIAVENGTIPAGQAGVNKWDGTPTKPTGLTDNNSASIPVDTSGVATFVVKSENKDNVKVNLYKKEGTDGDAKWVVEKTLTIKVKAGAITADAASAATFIGNEVDLSGANELGGTLTFFVKGPNFAFGPVPKDTTGSTVLTANGKEWEATVKTAALKTTAGKKPDAGNYTIYVAKLTSKVVASSATTGQKNITDLTAVDLDNSDYCDAYTTVVVALKQPFCSIPKLVHKFLTNQIRN